MRRSVKHMLAFVLAAVVASTLMSCGNDGGSAGPGGPGIAGADGNAATGTGGANEISFEVTLTGMQMVPAIDGGGSAHVTVTLNKTSGNVTVTGTFNGLSSPATEGHVHGPAAAGSTGPVLFPLSVPADVSGAVTGGASMSSRQMADMLTRMTYVDIHSYYFGDGEIRAQVSDLP